jgi:hypothetical protein
MNKFLVVRIMAFGIKRGFIFSYCELLLVKTSKLTFSYDPPTCQLMFLLRAYPHTWLLLVVYRKS